MKAPVLTKIAQRLYFATLYSLETLDFPELKEAFSLEFYHTQALKELNGFGKLEKLNGSFAMTLAPSPAPSLIAINGLNALKSASALVIQNDQNTSKLLEIKGFKSLTDIQSVFTISGVPQLKDLSGMANLTTVGQDFNIYYTGIVKLDVFKKLEGINKGGSAVTINWHYEEDDEDMLEAGEDYQAIINVPFKMIMINE